MKKLVILLAVISLCVGFTIPTYAISSNTKQLDGYELSLTRFSAKIKNKSDEEIGKDILRKLGMSEDNINSMPKEKLEEVCNAKSIRNETEYGKINQNGETLNISEEQYKNEIQNIDLQSANNIQPLSAGDSWSASGEDKLFSKTLFIVETKNAPAGTFGIISSFEWKNFTGHYKGEEIFSLSGEGLVFDRSSFLMHTQFVYQQTTSQGISNGTKYEDLTSDNISDYNDLQGEGFAISFHYNLPNNLYSPWSSLIYSNAGFLFMCSARLQQYDQANTFNVYANYFHQTVGFGSLGVSVNVNGASVSVSPSLLYSKYQIMTDHPINYEP